MIKNKKSKKQFQDFPYFIEVYTNGCSKCGEGRSWKVVGPYGVTGNFTYFVEENAQNIVDMLNDAYYKGVHSVQKPIFKT